MGVEEHPFVERIRAERAIVTAVNGCRGVVGVELAGTSEKAIEDWFDQMPVAMRCRVEIGVLRVKLEEAGRTPRLASRGSHRGAMIAERVRRDASEHAVEAVEQAASDVLRLGQRARSRRP